MRDKRPLILLKVSGTSHPDFTHNHSTKIYQIKPYMQISVHVIERKSIDNAQIDSRVISFRIGIEHGSNL
jgi:hypothetical protein